MAINWQLYLTTTDYFRFNAAIKDIDEILNCLDKTKNIRANFEIFESACLKNYCTFGNIIKMPKMEQLLFTFFPDYVSVAIKMYILYHMFDEVFYVDGSNISLIYHPCTISNHDNIICRAIVDGDSDNIMESHYLVQRVFYRVFYADYFRHWTKPSAKRKRDLTDDGETERNNVLIA